MTWLWVALAGGLGAALRGVVDSGITALQQRRAERKQTGHSGKAAQQVSKKAGQNALKARAKRPLPLGIATVNVLGALLMGLAFGYFAQVGSGMYAVLTTGFLGGFTTFSTAMLDVVQLHRQRRPAATVGMLVGTFALAVAALLLGALAGAALR